MKTLILFSTRDGQTREIANVLAAELSGLSVESDVIDLNEAGNIRWEGYERVVIGASIRYGHFSPVLDTFIKQHCEKLSRMASAFFSVNLVARKPEKNTPQTNGYTHKFLMRSPWQPDACAVFAGALRYPRYRWFDRLMIQLIMKMTGGETDTRKEVVYTNWQDVSVFAQKIAQLTGKSAL